MATFGNSGAPTGFTADNITINYAIACQFTTPSDCTSITSMSFCVYDNAGTKHIKGVIWNGSTMAVVGSTPAITCPVSAAYVNGTFFSAPTVSANTVYYFGFVADDEVNFYYKANTGTNQRYHSSNSYTTPASLGDTGDSANTTDGWYMTYTASGGATPINATPSENMES
jgi:hypothetical protein